MEVEIFSAGGGLGLLNASGSRLGMLQAVINPSALSPAALILFDCHLVFAVRCMAGSLRPQMLSLKGDDNIGEGETEKFPPSAILV
ncbi:hypothetical protein Q1695_004586 [Nippostrongylus brasiliensis]|nr:hypothetical protein Q1695_004586 [Nippostrongylus brasiliensis]